MMYVEVSITLLVGLSLRRGEVLALSGQDVDLEKGKVCIRKNMIKIDKQVIFKDPKLKQAIERLNYHLHD